MLLLREGGTETHLATNKGIIIAFILYLYLFCMSRKSLLFLDAFVL